MYSSSWSTRIAFLKSIQVYMSMLKTTVTLYDAMHDGPKHTLRGRYDYFNSCHEDCCIFSPLGSLSTLTYNIMRSIFSTISWHCNEQIFLHHLASLQFSDLIQCESLDPHPLSIPGSWASATVSSHSSSLIITLCRWVSELWSKKRADKMCALYFVYDREMMFRILAWPASLVISSKDIQMQLLFGGPHF